MLVGFTVGDTTEVGESEGAGEGAQVGNRVGIAEGLLIGLNDGDVEGVLGKADGKELGLAVGLFTGILDGDLITGNRVGGFVGLQVGLFEINNVPSSLAPAINVDGLYVTSHEAVGDSDCSSDKSEGNSDGIFVGPRVGRHEGLLCAGDLEGLGSLLGACVGLTVMLAFMLMTTCTPPLTKEVPGADAVDDPMTRSLNVSPFTSAPLMRM